MILPDADDYDRDAKYVPHGESEDETDDCHGTAGEVEVKEKIEGCEETSILQIVLRQGALDEQQQDCDGDAPTAGKWTG